LLNVVNELKTVGISDIRLNEPMKNHTTWKIGGPADLYITINSPIELQKVLYVLNKYEIRYKLIGQGSNILVKDEGYRGGIITLGNGFKMFHIDGEIIEAGAQYPLVLLANMAAKYNLTGLEFASGIPGNLGGAVYMNAGAHGSDISDLLVKAEVMLPDGKVEVWNNSDFQFRYRHSILQEKTAIVMNVTLKLNKGDNKEISEKMLEYKKRRLASQPYEYPCAGSVFRNPPNYFAGKLIEDLGLKGYRIGDAEISNKHANFIINKGKASAKDVLALINYVQEQIKLEYNIILIPEIIIIG